MWKAIACIACCVGVAELTMPPGRKWRHKESGIAANTGYSYKGQVRGAVDCSRVCSKQGNTRSYFYYDDTRECQCHDSTFTGGDASLQFVPNARYYEEVRDVIELAGMTYLPCPGDASEATDVFSSGASLFRVRAFVDTGERTYDEAQAVCVAHGGLLYKANTLEKFHLAQQLMMQCPAYMAYETFFVNGRYIVARDRYETTDGELIPMTQDFWAPLKPNAWGSLLCLSMSSRFLDYRWDDRECEYYSNIPAHAFCEIPQ